MTVNGDPSNGEMQRTLKRIEDKVDKSLDDHEQRLRSCEKYKYAFPPTLLTAIAGLVTAVTQWLVGG